ncbi:hypothetical protein GJ496_001097 [Pomphorhynchus laevis]|nr:hypothetical protein GJ496_001097 [Pomphorhynchus laevis]
MLRLLHFLNDLSDTLGIHLKSRRRNPKDEGLLSTNALNWTGSLCHGVMIIVNTHHSGEAMYRCETWLPAAK